MEGKKYDEGKPRFEFAPVELAAGANRAMSYGAEKYGTDNWRGGLDHTRLGNAAVRHLIAWLQGEDTDPESGLAHLDHAAASVGMLMASIARGYGKDDRPSKRAPKRYRLMMPHLAADYPVEATEEEAKAAIRAYFEQTTPSGAESPATVDRVFRRRYEEVR